MKNYKIVHYTCGLLTIKTILLALSECTFQELSEKVSGMTLLTFPGGLSAPLCSVLEIHQSFAFHFKQTNTGDNV